MFWDKPRYVLVHMQLWSATIQNPIALCTHASESTKSLLRQA